MIRALRIKAEDNVAVVLDGAHTGEWISVEGDGEGFRLRAAGTIPPGHKVALRPIAPGEDVIRYGYSIGKATGPISPGEHVHIHNVRGFNGASGKG